MNALLRWWLRRQLRDPHFSFLFAPPPQGEAVCLDCEASHLSAKTGELLSIGAIRIKDARLLTSEALRLTVRPQGLLEGRSIRIHRLRNVDVADGMEVQAALERLLEFIGSRPIVGYYIDFDIGLIDRYLKDWLGIRLPNRRIEVSENYYKWRFGKLAHRPADLRLETMIKVLELPLEGRHHDAYYDALTAGLIHLKLAAMGYGASR